MKVFLSFFALSLLTVSATRAIAEQSAAESVTFHMESYAGHFQERCMTLEGDRTLAIDIATRYPVRLNVHRHLETETLLLIDEIVAGSETKAISIPSAGEYCIEATNPENRPEAFDLRLQYRASTD